MQQFRVKQNLQMLDETGNFSIEFLVFTLKSFPCFLDYIFLTRNVSLKRLLRINKFS